MATFLHDYLGFEWNDMRVLTDDQTIPNRNNIIEAMHWLVEGAQPGDTLFYYFSGHAMQIKDIDGDELDECDECPFYCFFVGRP
ncbi:peptidase C14, caspase domain-containing protein [Lactarius psammicola]|nr:peptidase C14, caspase domain-containing protein [Lactarius psammicola]